MSRFCARVRRRFFAAIGCAIAIASPIPASAVVVNFGLGADDYGALTVNGVGCVYDNISAAGGCNLAVDMTPGVWYDIQIQYSNRLGSNGMALSWDQPGDPNNGGYGFAGSFPSLVPKANLRTQDLSGATVSGLRGDYTGACAAQPTVIGEGPINAINNIWNNQAVGSWNGCGYFSLFSETLTGQIRIAGTDPGGSLDVSCPAGALVPNVGLPEVVVPITIANKPVETRYGGLGLNFGIQSGNGSTTLCAAQSNTGALSVTGRLVPIDHVIPLAAYSMASASLAVFAPNSTGTIRPCAFGAGTTNGCILNGSFNRNSNYLLWQTAGFTTQITAFTPQTFATGPLSYWVDLQAFGISGSVSMESIIRSVEPYIHTTLIANLPPIAYYTWVQDPGSVTLLVRDANGLSTGVETNGEIREQIPGSFYVASPTNPAVVLTNPPGGSYSVQVTGVDTGEFDLSVASVEMRTTGIQQAAVSGEILQGATLSYSLDLASPPTSMTFSGQFDGGGQRPRDVNKLLSYANIASTQTNLPTGTTSFGLQILYGSGVAPGTFKAQLNGTDISAQFHPTPGRGELVVLPLLRGRNVLELQTDGDVGGRTSSDKDRLIFNAP